MGMMALVIFRAPIRELSTSRRGGGKEEGGAVVVAGGVAAERETGDEMERIEGRSVTVGTGKWEQWGWGGDGGAAGLDSFHLWLLPPQWPWERCG